MAEYIRKEDALDAVKHAWAKGIEPSQYIESLEPVDVVPVIRCKDCKFRENDDFCTGRGFPCQLVPDDGFCDKGERKG